MKKLLIATGNPAKLADYSNNLADLGIQIVSLKDCNITHEVDETGDSFEENALIKAREYMKLSGLPTLSDDAGIEIDALDGFPGISSRTWTGQRMTDEEIISGILEKLSGVPDEQRTAQFVAVAALVLPDGSEFTGKGVERGYVTADVSGVLVPGYPYNSIFKSHLNEPFRSELSEEEFKNRNHRRLALESIKPIIAKELQ